MFGGARLPGRLLAMLGGARLAAVMLGGVWPGVEGPCRCPELVGASDRLRGVPVAPPWGGRARPGGGIGGRPPPEVTTPAMDKGTGDEGDWKQKY